MKIILISIILIAVLSFSAYAGCCVLETSPNAIYWDFGNWSSQTKFCDNIAIFLSLNSTFYAADCNDVTLPAGSIDGWTSPTPISPPITGGGGGGGYGSSRTRTIPTCEEIAYVCDDWSACVNDMESRDCTKREVCGNIPTSRVVKETRSCTTAAVGEETTVEVTSAPQETVAEEPETTAEDEGGFAAVTGAVIGAIGRSPVAYGITFVVVIGILIGVASLYSKKKKTKKK